MQCKWKTGPALYIGMESPDGAQQISCLLLFVPQAETQSGPGEGIRMEFEGFEEQTINAW